MISSPEKNSLEILFSFSGPPEKRKKKNHILIKWVKNIYIHPTK